MPPRECVHIMTNGLKCRSFALKGKPYCQFHSSLHVHKPAARRVTQRLRPALPKCRSANLPSLLQISDDLRSGKINEGQARVMRSGLRLAAQILRYEDQGPIIEGIIDPASTAGRQLTAGPEPIKVLPPSPRIRAAQPPPAPPIPPASDPR